MHRNLECQIHESRQPGSGKKEMTRVNVDILEISELKWTGMGEFETQAGIKTAGRNIKTTDIQMTLLLWQKVKKN